MIKGIETENLDIYLDGIRNVGSELEHDRESDKWVNLANEEESFKSLASFWDSDGAYFYGGTPSYMTLTNYTPSTFTFEIIFSISLCENSIIFYNGSYSLKIINNKLVFGLNVNNVIIEIDIPVSIVNNMNHRVSITFDKRYLKGYINGALITTKDLGREYDYSTTDNKTLVLGGEPKSSAYSGIFFAGTFYSFRAYSKALSLNQIANNYKTDLKRYPITKKGLNKYQWQSLNSSLSGYIDYPIQWWGAWKKYNDYPCFMFSTYIGNLDGNCAATLLISDTEEGAKVTGLPASSDFFETYTFIYDDMTWYVGMAIAAATNVSPAEGMPFLQVYKHINTRSYYDARAYNPFSAATQFMSQMKVLTSRVIKDDDDPGTSTTGRVKYVRVRGADGSYSNALAFIVDSSNVTFKDDRSLDEHLEDKSSALIYGENGINLGRKTVKTYDEEDLSSGEKSVAIGQTTKATGDFSFAEGSESAAAAAYSHAEGQQTIASGLYSHAEGGGSEAKGYGSHVEGYYSIAEGEYSHAEGQQTEAIGKYSHSAGLNTRAEGDYSFAIGENTVAKGTGSFAAGKGTIAASDYQLVHGKYNIEDTEGKYLEIIGNGTDDEHRSNAYALTTDGDVEFSGKVKAKGFDGPAIYDIMGHRIDDYVYRISVENNILKVMHGNGAITEIELSGWDNIQEKIGYWTCNDSNVINTTKRKIIKFGYINKTSYYSACIFYAQLTLFGSPPSNTDKFNIDFRLYIDGEEYDATWNPTETLYNGYHIVTLMLPIQNIKPDNEVHIVTVEAKSTSGSARYTAGGIKVAFFGMGVNSGAVIWDGAIEYFDDFTIGYNITFNEFSNLHKDYYIAYNNNLTDYVSTYVIEPIRFVCSDNIFEINEEGVATGLNYLITYDKDMFGSGLMCNNDDFLGDSVSIENITIKFKVLGDNKDKYHYTGTYITSQYETDETKLSKSNLLLQSYYGNNSTDITSSISDIDNGKAVSLEIDLSNFNDINSIFIKEGE